MMKTFLQAEWRKLAIANYSVDKKILDKHLPPKTEIDLWNDICYVSLVGFMFKDTKIKDLKFHFTQILKRLISDSMFGTRTMENGNAESSLLKKLYPSQH